MNEKMDTPTRLFLVNGWHIKSSTELDLQGGSISLLSKFSDWFPTSIPSTVLHTLVQNRQYKDPYHGKNLEKIPKDHFLNSWWFLNEFQITAHQLESHAELNFEGINYSANIWLNGKKIASRETITGTFRTFNTDISLILIPGKNVLAVEVFPPKAGDYSIGFVDWNPSPPDNNMGIWRPVYINFTKNVSIKNVFVKSKFPPNDYSNVSLIISVELTNHSKKPIKGYLSGNIGDIQFTQLIELATDETRTVILNAELHPSLNISNPKLWWPNLYGKTHLYTLDMHFKEINGMVSDKTSTKFGIREIKDYFNKSGHRGFIINGEKILIKGAGWVDDLLLGDTEQSLETQIRYVKHMNLNTIRLEGFWGKDHTLYELCDRHGILIMVGWSCHWEHEEYLGKHCDDKYGGILSSYDIELISLSFRDQLIRLRNHPSIFIWTVGSDKLPLPELENKYIDIFNTYDNTRPYLASTGGVGSDTGVIVDAELTSDISGETGVKMLGPYAYTPPVYWYTNKTLGGAYGFNTETGPGAQVPPMESLIKMLPKENLWPIDDMWSYHCGRNVFGALDRFVTAQNNRYGISNGPDDFAKTAQLMNYELMRPMFEAFRANKYHATGVIQWMLNSAWPEMYWQLYDHYLMPNGAFYGAKKACEPIHLIYRYGHNDIFLVNGTLSDQNNLRADIKFYDINSTLMYQKQFTIDSKSNASIQITELPDISKLSNTYFFDLQLIDNIQSVIDRNFYWLSKKPDILDYESDVGEWNFHTPSKEFADFTMLKSMPKAHLEVTHDFKHLKEMQKINVTLKNTANFIAFFVYINLIDPDTRESVIPVFWEDNYISVLPGETRLISGDFLSNCTNPELSVSGLNL